jgi:hypothetical protein
MILAAWLRGRLEGFAMKQALVIAVLFAVPLIVAQDEWNEPNSNGWNMRTSKAEYRRRALKAWRTKRRNAKTRRKKWISSTDLGAA